MPSKKDRDVAELTKVDEDGAKNKNLCLTHGHGAVGPSEVGEAGALSTTRPTSPRPRGSHQGIPGRRS